METVGAVFLPAEATRDGTSIYDDYYTGFYWSSTHADASGACRVYFNDGFLYVVHGNLRYYGFPVRPVQDYTAH